MAVADRSLPVWRPKSTGDLTFYRKQTLEVLARYLHTAMQLGRTPCILGKTVFRGRVTFRRMFTMEDMLIFVLDVEKCLKRLDRVSQSVVAHMALQDYTPAQTAWILHESERTVHRIYNEAMDRLSRHFLEIGFVVSPDEKLSRGAREIESNETRKQTSYTEEIEKKVGSVLISN
jgi:hypothetical protein